MNLFPKPRRSILAFEPTVKILDVKRREFGELYAADAWNNLLVDPVLIVSV